MLESISQFNLHNLVYIALKIVERWSNKLDSMPITNFPYLADLVWNDAVGNNTLSMHSIVAT